MHGSNPANAKEKQGDLFRDENTVVPINNADTTTVKNKVIAIK
jgi:hypothetical protein